MFLLFSQLSIGQRFDNGSVDGPKTTIEMNLISGPVLGQTIYNSDTNTDWQYNGTTWVNTGTGGGLSQTDIDTFAELDAIVADETLSKASDIGVTVQGYNANTDTDETNDFLLDGSRAVTGDIDINGNNLNNIDRLAFSDGFGNGHAMQVHIENTQDFFFTPIGGTPQIFGWDFLANNWQIDSSPVVTQANAASLGIGSEVDESANYTWTGLHIFPSLTQFENQTIFKDVTGGDISSTLFFTELDGSTVKGSHGYSDNAGIAGVYFSNNQSAERVRLLDAGGLSIESEMDLNSNRITNLTDPTNAQDAVTKAYVDPDEYTQAQYEDFTTAEKLALGFYIIIPDAAPSGYSVAIDNDPVLANGSDSFSFALAEIGSFYDYTITSSGGGTPLNGFGVITTPTQQVSNIDLSGLSDGTITLTAYLTNATGQGINAQDTAAKSPSLLPAPLASNPNPELVMGNALAFGTDEVNGVAGISSSLDKESALVDDGYVGDYVIRTTETTNNFQTLVHSTGVTATANEVFEYAVVARRVSGSGNGTIRMRIGGNNTSTHTISTTGAFQLYSNTFSEAAGGAVDFQFLQATAGDVFEMKVSIKRQ